MAEAHLGEASRVGDIQGPDKYEEGSVTPTPMLWSLPFLKAGSFLPILQNRQLRP